MTVFDVFTSTPYTFLQIKRGTVAGDVIESQTDATGVFKLRTGATIGDNAENRESTATLHVRPTESFIQLNNGIVGHGIRVMGNDYQVLGLTGGMNYDTGQMEHYTATLAAADFSDYEVL